MALVNNSCQLFMITDLPFKEKIHECYTQGFDKIVKPDNFALDDVSIEESVMGHLYLAMFQGQKIGKIWVSFHDVRSAHLCSFNVSPFFRGCGVGSMILSHVLSIIKRNGAYIASLDSVPTAIKLYERHGFQIIRRFGPLNQFAYMEKVLNNRNIQ